MDSCYKDGHMFVSRLLVFQNHLSLLTVIRNPWYVGLCWSLESWIDKDGKEKDTLGH